MISKEKWKEIILSNRFYILHTVEKIVRREEIHIPEKLKRVIILYGVRRSGKTFILYDLFRKFKETSLYIDFEDERLMEFELSDFERLNEAFLELNPSLLSREKVFLFDEIQNITGWEKFSRRIVEKGKAKLSSNRFFFQNYALRDSYFFTRENLEYRGESFLIPRISGSKKYKCG